jgi:hypothetical protein
MRSLRILGCWSVLGLACAAPNAAGPSAETPDGASEPDPVPGPGPGDVKTPPTSPAPDAMAAGGSGGNSGGGSTVSPDAQPAPPADTGAPTSPPDPTPVDTESYACTRIIGINATAEWYSKGFETMVDNGKWELVRVHSGFVELWANPSSGAWSTGPTSACAGGAKPDRIIFIGLNFDTNTLEQWVPPLTAVVKNLQAKFPGLKRIELGTFVRAPGNKPCPQAPAKRSTITAAQDEANAMVAAANPELVRVSPKFEAKTCGEFSGNPPHPSGTGGAAWAKMMAEHYAPK